VKTLAIAFVSGAMFAVGLTVSGMTQPHKVVAFLDVAGQWDPSLAFVMIGAIGIYLPAFQWMRRRRPLLDPAMLLPDARPVDARLLLGAAIFGVGWGASGFCPGPAVVSISTGAAPAVVFVLAMVAGNALARLAENARAASTDGASSAHAPTCG
jgi:uncharacterized membrane protein YedE/YeeE